jgi:hypothetical protein
MTLPDVVQSSGGAIHRDESLETHRKSVRIRPILRPPRLEDHSSVESLQALA